MKKVLGDDDDDDKKEEKEVKKVNTEKEDDLDDDDDKKKKDGVMCIFGICLQGKKEFEQDKNLHANRDKEIEELQRQTEEVETWKKEEQERADLQAEENRAKAQEQRDGIIAQSCQCTWECGDRNDGTVCFRRCCNNEFGGPGTPEPPKEEKPPELEVMVTEAPKVAAEEPKKAAEAEEEVEPIVSRNPFFWMNPWNMMRPLRPAAPVAAEKSADGTAAAPAPAPRWGAWRWFAPWSWGFR